MNHTLINPKTHSLLNGRILVKLPVIGKETGRLITSIDISQDYRECIRGELIAYNEFAFMTEGKEWEEKPEIGDTVFFAPYSGRVYEAGDEERYRNMSSKDLTGFEKQ
jgi:co-chaperonin GroES (HSP10)